MLARDRVLGCGGVARARGGDFCASCERVVQQVLDAEMTSFLGAGAYSAMRSGEAGGTVQARGAEDTGGPAGVAGAQGSGKDVSDGVVRALPAQREALVL